VNPKHTITKKSVLNPIESVKEGYKVGMEGALKIKQVLAQFNSKVFSQDYQNQFSSIKSEWYDRRFTKVNVEGIAKSYIHTEVQYLGDGTGNPDITYLTYNSGPLTVIPDQLITLNARSSILGSKLNDTYKAGLKTYYAESPFVVPAEICRFYNYSTGPNAGGLQCNNTIPLINPKEIIHLFPRSANELTCFRNPHYKNLTVSLLNKNLPKLGANTLSAEFYKLERDTLNFSGLFTPTTSVENSYTQEVIKHFPFRNRCDEDDTDFVVIFNLERPSADAFHNDTVNSSNETINLKGDPIEYGEGDVYYVLNSENDSTQP
jgi:hypothetical protein